MISVSASAISVVLPIKPPSLESVFPDNPLMIINVIVVGLVISLVAAKGYNAVAKFANIVAPWMAVMFIVLGLSTFPILGIDSIESFWDKAQNVIWQGNPQEGFVRFTSVSYTHLRAHE